VSLNGSHNILGFETNEIMSSMPGLLDLAAAAQMDLGRAADIASNIISGFGYEAEEAGRVSDVLASGASSANTTVEQLGDAMATVAPVASSLGLDIEDLTAAVGFMSDAGLQGSRSGRMLRQGMLRLASPTGAAADLIDELGINVFDADGNMKAMHEVVGELEQGLGDMSSEAQTAALTTIFGAQTTAGWTALIERGSDELAEYTGQLQDSEGAASEMAETMMDNAKGALIEFRSALEGVGIALSEHLLPSVTRIIEQGTDLVRGFGELDESTQKWIVNLGLAAAAIGPVMLAVGPLVTGIGTLTAGMGALSLGIAGAGGLTAALGGLATALGPIGLTVAGVTAAIGGLAYGGYKLNEWMQDAAFESNIFSDEISESTQEAVGAFLDLESEAQVALRGLQFSSREITEEMAEELTTIYDTMHEQILVAMEESHEDRIEAMHSLFGEESSISEERAAEMLGILEERHEEEKETIQEYHDERKEIIQNALEEERDLTDEEHERISEIDQKARESAVEHLSESKAEQLAILEGLKQEEGKIDAERAAEIVSNSIERRDEVVAEAEQEYEDLLAVAAALREDGTKESAEMADEIVAEAERQRDGTVAEAEAMHEEIVTEAQEMAGEFVDEIAWMSGEVMNNAEIMTMNVGMTFADLFLTVKNGVTDMATDVVGSVTGMKDDFVSEISELRSESDGIWSAIALWVAQKAEEMNLNSVASIIRMVADIIGKWEEIESFFSNIDLGTVGENIMEGLRRGIVRGATSVVTTAYTTATNIVSAFRERLSIFSPSRVMRDEVGREIIRGIIAGMRDEEENLNQTVTQLMDTMMDTFNEGRNRTRIRAIRESEISLLETQIDYLQRAGASEEELARAKELQIDLAEQQERKQQEYNNRIREQEGIVREVERAYSNGYFTLEEYNELIEKATTDLNSLWEEAINFNQNIAVEQYRDMERAQDDAIEKAEELQRIYEDTLFSAADLFSGFASSDISIFSDVMADEFDRLQQSHTGMENAFQRETDAAVARMESTHQRALDLFDERTQAHRESINEQIRDIERLRDADIAAIDERLDAMREEEQADTRRDQEAQWDEERSHIERRMQIAELYNDEETMRAVEREMQDLEESISEQRRQWEREDEREALQAEKRKIEQAAQLKIDELNEEADRYEAERALQREHIEEKQAMELQALENERQNRLRAMRQRHDDEQKAHQREVEMQQQKFEQLQGELARAVEEGRLTQEQANAAWLQAVEDLGIEELNRHIQNQENVLNELDEYTDEYLAIGESFADGLIDGLIETLERRMSEVQAMARRVQAAASATSGGGGGFRVENMDPLTGDELMDRIGGNQTSHVHVDVDGKEMAGVVLNHATGEAKQYQRKG
jgi:TP901 family phage tail tape measure protein